MIRIVFFIEVCLNKANTCKMTFVNKEVHYENRELEREWNCGLPPKRISEVFS